MIFPDHVLASLLKPINPNWECWLPTYPCERVQNLPDLVFNLNGREYVLTGEEYTSRFSTPICPEVEDRCMPGFTRPWEDDQLF
jgi:hypothetical protein